jgi:D-sedoheptulose 7-phosphate isomerase
MLERALSYCPRPGETCIFNQYPGRSEEHAEEPKLSGEKPFPSSKEYMTGLCEVLSGLPFHLVDQISETLYDAHLQGRTTYLLGNGGSAALASHMACDLGKGTIAPGRPRFSAVSLTDNVPLLTAWANDFQFEDIFAQQLLNVVEKGDVVFAITTSGNSLNVVKALEVGRDAGALNIGITGFDGGRILGLCDLCLVVPSENVQHIEDAHLCLAHSVFSAVRHRLMHAEAGRLAAASRSAP